MTDNTTLELEAQKYGLRDMDLLKLVDAGTHPKAAVDDLVRRYPGAFSRPLNGLSRKQYEAAKSQYLTACLQTQRTEDDARTLRLMEEKYRSTTR